MENHRKPQYMCPNGDEDRVPTKCNMISADIPKIHHINSNVVFTWWCLMRVMTLASK